MDTAFHRAVRRRLDAGEVSAERPARVYAMFRDQPNAPALYAVVEWEGEDVPVIVHNFKYYERSMQRWNAGFIELLILNELHELTHWAMTDAEREYFEGKSRRANRPDGYWLNRTLFSIINWLPSEPRSVIEPSPPLWRRVIATIRDRFTMAVSSFIATDRPSDD